MKRALITGIACLSMTPVFLFGNNVSASEISTERPITANEEVETSKTFVYTAQNLTSFNVAQSILVLNFSDGTSVSMDNFNPAHFDIDNFEIQVQEYYSKSSKAGGAINFPNSVTVSATSYGTTSYPPAQKYASTTRRKAYKERVYEARYGGNIPLSSIQGGSTGGKTYIYSGSVPYIDHKMV